VTFNSLVNAIRTDICVEKMSFAGRGSGFQLFKDSDIMHIPACLITIDVTYQPCETPCLLRETRTTI
jgi:hypothetical protein